MKDINRRARKDSDVSRNQEINQNKLKKKLIKTINFKSRQRRHQIFYSHTQIRIHLALKYRNGTLIQKSLSLFGMPTLLKIFYSNNIVILFFFIFSP